MARSSASGSSSGTRSPRASHSPARSTPWSCREPPRGVHARRGPWYDATVSEDLEPTIVEPHTHIDGAVMISFGAVQTGREALAVETFLELSRYLGQLLTDGVIAEF